MLRHPLWIGIAAALAGWLVIQTEFWRHVELRIFDALVTRSAPNAVSLPITIVGIIEVMKLMNTVRAGARGVVREIRARDGTLVEYGETLLTIDPRVPG